MIKHVHDETLRELWAIKDETAARFRTADEYLRHLGLTQLKPKPIKRRESAKRGNSPKPGTLNQSAV